MCNILILPSGVMPKRHEFDNMVYNNWHAYGLISQHDGQTEVLKYVPPVDDEEIKPAELWNLIEERREFDRYLHVRHITAGANTEDNCHPIKVFDDGKEQIYFMHNGTMEAYKPKKQVMLSGAMTIMDDDDGDSDTMAYAKSILIPLFKQFVNQDGELADLSNMLMKRILASMWPASNRGLLVSSNGDWMRLGTWTNTKGVTEEGTVVDIHSSNTTYFDKVLRGPEFKRREEEAKKDAPFQADEVGVKGVVDIAKYDYKIPPKASEYKIEHEYFKKLFNEAQFYDRTGLVKLGYLTCDEYEHIYNLGRLDCVQLMNYAFTDYSCLYQEFEELEKKHEKASKLIAELKAQLKKEKAA